MRTHIFKIGVIVCLSILIGGAILQTMGGSPNGWGVDDAFIGYRYSRNLATGQGLVFNPGERVEGYSDFLYVVLMAPAFWVTDLDGAFFFSAFLNLVFACAAFLLFVGYVRRRLGEGEALAAAVLLAFCLPLWVAVAWGLETPLVVLVSMAVWLTVEEVVSDASPHSIHLLCLAMVLSLLARADGFIIVGVALFYLALKRRYRALATSTCVVAMATIAIELGRILYYHAVLPTTFYVKVAGPLFPRIVHAYRELSTITLFEGLAPLLLAIAACWVEETRNSLAGLGRVVNGLRFDLIFPVVWLFYWFYIGGDIYWDRFLIILFPMGIFALLSFFAKSSRGKVLAFVVVVLAIMETAPAVRTDSRFSYQFQRYDGWIVAGKFLGRTFPGKILATGALGKIPFFSGLYTQDVLGLNDPVLAHRPAIKSDDFEPGDMKFDPDYSLSRKPDVIANWIHEDLGLTYGLTREKYRAARYQVRFLVYTGATPPAQGIIDVSGADDATIQQLIGRGYNYAVLVRESVTPQP